MLGVAAVKPSSCTRKLCACHLYTGAFRAASRDAGERFGAAVGRRVSVLMRGGHARARAG